MSNDAKSTEGKEKTRKGKEFLMDSSEVSDE